MTCERAVVFTHLRFDGVRQRPQHLVSRLAERLPVLIVEEPLGGASDADDVVASGDAFLLRPRRRDPSGAIDARTMAAIEAWLGGASALAWVYATMMAPALDALAFERVVFDRMDDLAAFRFAPAESREREAALIRRADLVFTGGRTLYESIRAAGPKVRLYPSGIEVAHFAAAAWPGATVDPLVRGLAGPVFGYAGVVDERLDLSLFAALAESGDVVVAGPFAKIDPAELPGGARLHYTGLVPYARLPALLAGFDVALMPFAANEATRSLSPTKAPEYLAAGVPVVSTPVADVVRDYGDVVAIAPPEEFAATAVALAAAVDAPRRDRGIARAARADWDAIFARMWSDLTAS